MKRTRQINPGFFTNDELADITPLGRLLFAGLWVIADREGRLEDRPKKIKAEILPYDNCDVDDLLNQLQNAGFIKRYKVDIPRTDQGNTMDTPRMPSSLYLVSSNSESNNNSLICINNKQTENGKQVNQQHTLAENEFAECIKYYQKRIHPFTGIVEREFVATLIQDYGEKLFKQGVDITASNASYKGAKIWRYLAAVLKRLKEKPDRTAGNNAFDDVLDEIIGGDDNA